MENASQALIIAGAILLAILIIAIGMYIYNSAQANITDSLNNMNTQQIEAFNNQFESYKGTQTGSQISALMGRLIGNANTYKDEYLKLPKVNIDKTKATGGNSVNAVGSNDSNQQAYINNLSKIKNQVENKHAYTVTFEYGTEGLINEINIKY